jgi:protein arginine N-methyltransferase 2
MHLQKIGLDVDWNDIDVTAEDEERWLRSRQYFSLPLYRLPIVKLRVWDE